MRAVAVAFALCVLSCHSTTTHFMTTEDPHRINREMALPVVLLMAPDGSAGSGVVISQDATRALILTAAHVVFDRDGCQFETVGALRHSQKRDEVVAVSAKVLRARRDRDMALLETEPVWPAVAKVATREQLRHFYLYSRVWLYGHAAGATDGQLTEGRVCDFDDGGKMRYSAPTWFGNSGGPVYADIDGAYTIVSICQAGYMGLTPDTVIPHMGLGARPYDLIHFLEGK